VIAPAAYTGELVLLGWDALRGIFRRPLEIRETVTQMYRLGVTSLPLVGLTNFFTGAVMTLQISYTLSAYGARAYAGAFIGISMVKELGPVLTAVMVAARVGAGITAELGSMEVTEQVEALRALGASPAKKLVAPRLLALVTLLPILTIIGIAIGIIGGLYIATVEVGQGAAYYLSRVRTSVVVGDVVTGLAKTVFFGLFIGIIACRNGLRARGGATGVGRATTETVVAASIAIFVSNFFFSKLFLVLQTVFAGWGG
jgi:phospholipid/cholesterol/gamma-HCH transport system permease protein